MGQHLKVEDQIIRRIDGNGQRSEKNHSWKVVELIPVLPLGLEDLKVGQEYGVFVYSKNSVLPLKLEKVDLQSREYTFTSLTEATTELKAAAHNLPAVYPVGTTRHKDVDKIVIECSEEGISGTRRREEIPMKRVRKYRFDIDVGPTHVVECVS
jgi:hypothetical protein